jgi:hypothetical protein
MSKYKKNLVDWYSQVKLFFLHGGNCQNLVLDRAGVCSRKKGPKSPFHYYGVARFYSSF